jgi:hypothetical protein
MKAELGSPKCTTTGIAGCPKGTKCMKFEEAVKVLAGTLAATPPNKRNNEARRILRSLTESSHLMTGIDSDEESWCWLG